MIVKGKPPSDSVTFASAWLGRVQANYEVLLVVNPHLTVVCLFSSSRLLGTHLFGDQPFPEAAASCKPRREAGIENLQLYKGDRTQ